MIWNDTAPDDREYRARVVVESAEACLRRGHALPPDWLADVIAVAEAEDAPTELRARAAELVKATP